MPSDAAPSGVAQEPRRVIAMLAPCPFPTAQGTQVVIRHLATALSRAGHDVHVITYGYGDPNLTSDSALPFHLHRTARLDAGLRSGPSLLKPAADAALMFTAARVVKAHHCELIHAHNIEGLALGALLKLQTGLPLVYHAHNAMGPELPTYFRARFAQAFASMVGDALDRSLPRAADVVVVFDAVHKAMHETYGVEAARVHVIPPGLDPSELAVSALDSPAVPKLGPGPWLLYAGNADGYQNLPLLWQAMAMLKERRNSARLLVATHHDPKVFAPGIAAAGVADRVEVHQHHSLAELRGFFAQADVGVCPRSLWAGAPVKVLNYLAAGLPVVACHKAGRHLLSDDVGALVDETPEAFADGIEVVLEKKYSRACVQQAFVRFDVGTHLPFYERAYAAALRPS